MKMLFAFLIIAIGFSAHSEPMTDSDPMAKLAMKAVRDFVQNPEALLSEPADANVLINRIAGELIMEVPAFQQLSQCLQDAPSGRINDCLGYDTQVLLKIYGLTFWMRTKSNTADEDDIPSTEKAAMNQIADALEVQAQAFHINVVEQIHRSLTVAMTRPGGTHEKEIFCGRLETAINFWTNQIKLEVSLGEPTETDDKILNSLALVRAKVCR